MKKRIVKAVRTNIKLIRCQVPWAPKSSQESCPKCSGDGVHLVKSKATNNLWVEAKCLDCDGSGVKSSR